VKNAIARPLILIAISLLMVPAFARGGFGGFGGGRGGFGGGGFDRGGFGGGGFDRGGFGGGGDGFHNFNSAFDHANVAGTDHNWNGVHDYGAGGGFNSIAGTADHSNFGNITAHNPTEVSSATGFGSIAGSQNKFGGTTNAGNFDHNTTVNNFGHNYTNEPGGSYHPYGGYADHPYAATNGYHPYGGYGYHPYGAYGYHGYGYHPYGYHPYYGYGGIYGYPGGWCNAGFMEASMWTCMGMSSMFDFLGLAALSSSNNKKNNSNTQPVNITYEGGNTYISGVPAAQYYQQAQQLAASAPPVVTQPGVPGAGAPGAGLSATQIASLPPRLQQIASDIGGQLPGPNASMIAPSPAEKWEPLGVYSLLEPGQSKSTTLFQLAINKEGVVRGNYMNEITSEKAQIHGALDKKTQRLSWTVGENPSTVFSTDLTDLVKDKGKVVVQFGPDNTQQMSFKRQPKPKQSEMEQTQQQQQLTGS